jgi:hypothetical protein
MVLHGPGGQRQALGNLGVGQALGHQPENLGLSFGQPGCPGSALAASVLANRGARTVPADEPAVLAEHQAGECRSEDRMPGRRRPYRVDQLGQPRGLKHVAHRACGDGLKHVLLSAAGGQHQHAGRRLRRKQAAGHLGAGLIGQVHVEQHDIGPGGRDDAQRLRPVARRPRDRVPGLGQVARGAFPPDRMIVHDQDADRRIRSCRHEAPPPFRGQGTTSGSPFRPLRVPVPRWSARHRAVLPPRPRPAVPR